jgi:hypothetical protein
MSGQSSIRVPVTDPCTQAVTLLTLGKTTRFNVECVERIGHSVKHRAVISAVTLDRQRTVTAEITWSDD